MCLVLKKMHLELLFPFRNFYLLKTENTVVEKPLVSYSQMKLLGRVPDVTAHPKGDDAVVVVGAACNYGGVCARSAVSPIVCHGCSRWLVIHKGTTIGIFSCSLIKLVFPDFLWQ